MTKSLTLLFLLLLPGLGHATTGLERVVETDWLQEAALKYGYVSSICCYQTLNGMVEGYRFSRETRHVVTEKNYHAYLTLRDVSGLVTGWFMYANVRDSELNWFATGKRFLAGALFARNLREWAYKGQRYGDPFDYSKAHNEHALVYFGFRGGKLVDLYIGTGPVSGPVVDLVFILGGLLLLE